MSNGQFFAMLFALSVGLNGILLSKILTPHMNLKAYGIYVAAIETIFLFLVFGTNIIIH